MAETTSFSPGDPLGGDPLIRRLAEVRDDLDISAMEVIGPIRRAQRVLGTALESLFEGAPVTPPELDVLVRLRHAEHPVIARRIADAMTLSPAAVSKTLAKLERRGFVERQPNPADRRAVLVTITTAGAEVVDALLPRQVAVESALLAGLGSDRERVVDALNLLVRVMERHADTVSGPVR
jgi:DNA-binding MarR family transcriptional regulator